MRSARLSRHRAALGAVVLLATAAACGGRGGALPTPSGGTAAATRAAAGGPLGGPTYYADVRPIVAAKCGGCHVAGGIAPFALTTYADGQAWLAATREAVAGDTMPPWQFDDGCATYANSGALTAAQKQTLLDWVDAGGPPGAPTADDAEGAGEGDGTLTAAAVDLTESMPAPYLPQAQPDEYRCFVLDWPETTLKYVTASGVVPGNPSIVHHASVVVLEPLQVAAALAKDGADGHPGFACDTGTIALSAGISGWLPGQVGMTPVAVAASDVGFAVPPGAKLLLQVHYHVEGALQNVRPDQTSVLFHLEGQVRRVAVGLRWADPLWVVSPRSMLVPAGAADVVHSYAASPSLLLAAADGAAGHGPLAIYGGTPHMHLRGRSLRVWLTHADGSQQCLFNMPRWNASWEAAAIFADPVPLRPDDQIAIACTWDNSAANQPLVNGAKQAPHDLVWGEDQDDEMCVATLRLAPP